MRKTANANEKLFACHSMYIVYLLYYCLFLFFFFVVPFSIPFLLRFLCGTPESIKSKRMNNQADKRHKKRMKVRKKWTIGFDREEKILCAPNRFGYIILTNMSLQIMSYGLIWLGLAVIFLQPIFYSFPILQIFPLLGFCPPPPSPPFRCLSLFLSLNFRIDRFIRFNLYRLYMFVLYIKPFTCLGEWNRICSSRSACKFNFIRFMRFVGRIEPAAMKKRMLLHD